MKMSDISHYYPAIVLILLSLFFMVFPGFAAFLVVTGLLAFGILYGIVVYRFHKFQERVRSAAAAQSQAPSGMGGETTMDSAPGWFNDFSDLDTREGRPTFRGVSVLYLAAPALVPVGLQVVQGDLTQERMVCFDEETLSYYERELSKLRA